MIDQGFLANILDSLRSGDLSKVTADSIKRINEITMSILRVPNQDISEPEKIKMRLIIIISNILYNNTGKEMLVLDDGVYDLLLEKYKNFDPNYQVGAEPILFDQGRVEEIIEKKTIYTPIIVADKEKIDEGFYCNHILDMRQPITKSSFIVNPINQVDQLAIEKRSVNTPHLYPKLVGTLDKVKFVLDKQARDLEVYNDSNVKIFERDFLAPHIISGIIDPNRVFTMVGELKYDGVSVEAEVTNQVETARSRGDTGEDIATDLTPYLKGYRFRGADEIKESATMDPIGMKFEAIITKPNLDRLSNLRGKTYKNCRNAIIGILGSSDGYLFRDLITLVPLATSLENIGRLEEIEFLNRYYTSGEYLRYVVFQGNYTEILYQVKKFTEEMEFIRPYMPFLYDGVVISYVDEDIIKALGRENSVNKYQIAIKFNPMKKYTTFLGYTYTVGQNGIITPLAHYNPVEFLGGIHQKCTVNSYARFHELNLRVGDIVALEYVNDVMPRISKPDIEDNLHNTNPVEKFIEICPECKTTLVISPSGKSAICPNKKCPGRTLARMVNMLQKLNLKDFSEEALTVLAKDNLGSLMNLTMDSPELIELGPVNAQKFLDRMNTLKTQSIEDYKIVGALGFSNIAQAKWKIILRNLCVHDLVVFTANEIRFILSQVKGIGDSTIDTIIEERELMMDDLMTIVEMPNLIVTFGSEDKSVKVRFTGLRDKNLMAELERRGCDASDGSVTKDTTYLIVPSEGFTSTKVEKAKKDGVKIVPYQEFINNIDLYVPVD